MKLWLISQDTNNNYETYDSAVVAAKTEAEAKMMHPLNGTNIRSETRGRSYWVGSPDEVNCVLLGTAKPGTEKSVICSSYNTG